MGLRESLSDARRSSQVVQSLERAIQHSTVVDRALTQPSPVTTMDIWVRSSATATVFQNASEFSGDVDDRSRIGSVVSAIRAFTQSSYIYRWLTAEPEPEVVVVDLRETMVLGPLLPVVDNLVETFLASRPGSRLCEAGNETMEFVEDAPIRALSIVVVTAIIANVLVRLSTGSMTAAGLLIRIGFAFIAILGLRFEVQMDDLRDTWAARLLVALLEPPEPLEERAKTSEELDVVYRRAESRDDDP